MRYLYLSLTLSVLAFSSCQREDDIQHVKNHDELEITDLDIPEGFTFETSQVTNIRINDNTTIARYNIYEYHEGKVGGLIASAAPKADMSATLQVKLPKFLDAIRVERITTTGRSYQNVMVNTRTVFVDFPSNRQARMASCTEQLFAVNNDGGFYSIDNESSEYSASQLSALVGGGSIACAVDKQNRRVYYNTGTTLRYYDIDAQTYHIAHTGNPFGGNYPRMEYNQTNGRLYIASNEKMYVISPADGQIYASYDIIGLENPVSGGDLAISLDGTIYMCCFSGLYRIEINGAVANATRISAESLPFQPTSMAIDRNDRLYLATNDANSQLIAMDKQDGAWEVMKVYNHKIHDLSSLPCSIDELDQTDTDTDGIIDPLDDYPNDANKAFESFTPSEFGWGSIGFEDLWPAAGDYDFNDLTVDYKFTAVQNSNNDVVELRAQFKINSLNASFKNGFGIQFPFSPDVVASVTGNQLTEGITTSSANGTEAGQSKAVVIVFENGFKHGNYGECVDQPDTPIDVVITFTSPQNVATMGTAPFNPFIFINGLREKEVHLAGHEITDLGSTEFFDTGDDQSTTGATSFVDKHNLPWGIDMIHQIRVPKSGQSIKNGYTKFGDWAQTGGQSFQDWYKDNQGYRVSSNICMD